MKTYGVCNRQSARKHRRAGHKVQRLPSGRYMWSVRTYQREVLDSFARAAGAALFDTFKATKADEIEVTATCHNPQFTAARAGWVDVFTNDGGAYTINVGDEFWPRRRNQHSKKFKVLRIVELPERGTHLVSYSTPRGEMDSITAREFLMLVGKRVGE